MKRVTQKRQNFNVTLEEEEDILRLRETLGASSMKDALLRAARVVLTMAKEVGEGNEIYSAGPYGERTRILLPDMETFRSGWKYLIARPSSWKRQLFIKGRRVTAANVWFDMLANRRSIEETAENWSLPIPAVAEIIAYCEAERDLIGMEAEEEKQILTSSAANDTSGRRIESPRG